MKIIIAGGRDFRNYELLVEKLDNIFLNLDNDVEIVSGGQVTFDEVTREKYGADYLGEQYAIDGEYNLKRFPADWEGLGKKAGPIRNKQMAEYADALVAFWDGKSRGTKNMIDLAHEHKLKVRIITY